MQSGSHAYRPNLSTSEIITAVRRLLDEQRSGDRLLCRYLADLSDRVEARGFDVMGGYADIYHAAQCLFGLRKADPPATDLRRAVVLYECTSCRRTELETGAGSIELGAASAAALACGAPVHDLTTEGRIERRGGPMPTAVARAVRLRDRHRCRVPCCTRRRYVDVHHLQPRAAGGAHSRTNCLCLCDTHHRMLHEGQLHITGDPERTLEFRGADGHLLRDRPLPAATQGGFDELGSDASPDTALVLATMGHRGGWHIDAVCDATGLSVSTVTAALTAAEIAGRARCDAMGRWAGLDQHQPLGEFKGT